MGLINTDPLGGDFQTNIYRTITNGAPWRSDIGGSSGGGTGGLSLQRLMELAKQNSQPEIAGQPQGDDKDWKGDIPTQEDILRKMGPLGKILAITKALNIKGKFGGAGFDTNINGDTGGSEKKPEAGQLAALLKMMEMMKQQGQQPSGRQGPRGPSRGGFAEPWQRRWSQPAPGQATTI
jgi:hypothetical protein